MNMLAPLLLIHAVATLFMTGLIWFVQVVHYPLLKRVGEGAFCAYENEHCQRTTYVVLPPMLVELASAVALMLIGLEAGSRDLALLGVMLLAIIWLATFALLVPEHRRLCMSFDADAHRRLVRSNWLRTILWTVRAVIAVLLIQEQTR